MSSKPVFKNSRHWLLITILALLLITLASPAQAANPDFQEIQAVPTNGALDWEAFTIDGQTYLAVANQRSDSNFNIDSRIYQWNGSQFVEIQAIPTNGANDWEAFTIGNQTYLAVANEFNGSTGNIDSHIYEWNGSQFVEVQAIPTNAARDWEAFTIGSQTYLAVANHYNGSSWNIDSRIYQWNGSQFVEIQAIPTNAARDWEAFTIGSQTYLVVANHYNGSSYNIDSRIYEWNGSQFVGTQTTPTNGATDWEPFTIGSQTYLAVANFTSGSSYNIDSRIYRAQLQGDCQLDLTAAYNGAQMTLAYDLYAGPEPVTWSNTLTVQGSWFPLFSVPLPAGFSYNNQFSFGLPHYGTVGVFSQLVTNQGIVCYDFELVDTGGSDAPVSEIEIPSGLGPR